MGNLIPTSKIQYWVKVAAAFVRLSNLKDITPSTEPQTYERKYKDTPVISEVTTGVKRALEFEVELEDDGTLHDWLVANELNLNVATEVVRVKMFEDAAEPAVGYVAHKATAVLNLSPIDGDAGEYLAATGTISFTEEPVVGTFDPDTATFTPDA